MAKLLCKHLHMCFFKLKYSTTINHQSPPHPEQQHHHHDNHSTISFFNNSHLNKNNIDSLQNDAASTSEFFSSSSSDSDTWDTPPPDLASVFTSQRFFFSSPGRSNSIIEYSSISHTTTTTTTTSRPCNCNYNDSDHSNNIRAKTYSIPEGGVRVPKYSVDPYIDFRRSMQEMIDSRELMMMDVRKDWDYLHDLLLCYLALNPSNTHKYIIPAFTDLVVDLLSSHPSSADVKITHCRKLKNHRRHRSLSGSALV